MKVLILEPSASCYGGFAIPPLYKPLFEKGNRENVFPAFSSPPEYSTIAGMFDDAVLACDVLIAVCSDPSFALGVLVGRALSKKKFVCVLVPSYLAFTATERYITSLASSRRVSIMCDIFACGSDEKQSRYDAIESILKECDNFRFATSESVA